MTQPKTKREAEQAIQDLEQEATRAEARNSAGREFANLTAARAEDLRCIARDSRAEAARLRALLPTLPE